MLMRPTKTEDKAAHRATAMAEMAGLPIYIVHLSSEDALLIDRTPLGFHERVRDRQMFVQRR